MNAPDPCRAVEVLKNLPAHAGQSRVPAAGDAGSSLTVVLICTQKRWHGGEEQGALLARGLRRRGHRCLVLARSASEFAARMAAEGFEVLSFAGKGRNPLAVCQIRSHLRRVRHHVLHYNDPHAITAAGLASLGLGIPARVAARHLSFPIRSPFRYRMLCDRVLGVSHAVVRACRQSGIPAQSLRVVHGGIDPARIAPGDRARVRAALGIAEACPVLLTVAQLVECKGHAILLQALPSILHQYPGLQWVLAGDGPLRASLESQARQWAVGTAMRLLGHRPDVPDLMAAADLFVLPSLAEALPVTLMEAMLARCPIVTTTAGGIPDLTGDGELQGGPVAWTVPPADPQALATAILEALGNGPLRQGRAERGRQRVLGHFTADRMVEATLAVYREVLALGDR